MLVLLRKVNQSVVVANETIVSVAKFQGNRVSLSIRAPHNVRILRGELNEDSEFVPSTEDSELRHLVLSRKVGESIRFGETTVSVRKIKGHSNVSLGFEGPAHVSFRRAELATAD